MKTIKFLHYAKYPLLLLIAIFGILIGGSQNAPRPFAKDDIGGNGAGSTAPRNVVASHDVGIGGTQSPPRQIFSDNIGGIGGSQTAPRSFAMTADEIGGSQTAPRGFVANGAVEIGGGQTAPRDPSGYKNDPETSIGGNSAPRSFAYHCMEIGGGGNETRKLRYAAITETTDEIGGNQGAPRTSLLSFSNENDGAIVGQCVTHSSEPSSFVGHVPVKYSVYDFSDSIDIDFEIGGQTTPGSECRQLVSTEIGGGQTAPRELMDIGGNQTAPRQFEIGGQTVPSSRPLMLASVETTDGDCVPRASSLINGFPDIGGAQGAPRQ